VEGVVLGVEPVDGGEVVPAEDLIEPGFATTSALVESHNGPFVRRSRTRLTTATG